MHAAIGYGRVISLPLKCLFASIQAFSQEVTGKQGEYERVRGEGQHLLQLAHPQAVAVLGSNLQELERAWLDLRGRGGEILSLSISTTVHFESLWLLSSTYVYTY